MRKNLNILVTGASRGIGNAIASTIAFRAQNLLLTSLHPEQMDIGVNEVKKKCGGDIYTLNIDQSQSLSAAETVSNWANTLVNHIDVLILCAGNYFEGSLMEIPDNQFQNTLNTNFTSNYYLVKRLYPLLKKASNPRIIIIGSTAAYSAYEIPTYSVAKYALRGLATNLRSELMHDNIGVTFLSPGGTLTDMWNGVDLPPNRLLRPSDIAQTINALLDLSDQAVIEEIIIRPMLGDYNE